MTTRNKRSLTEITGDVESAQQYPSLRRTAVPSRHGFHGPIKS